MITCTLAELADFIKAELHGDPECCIKRIATLEAAREGDVTFLCNRRYQKYLNGTRASAVILSSENQAACPTNALVTSNPYLAYARAIELLNPAKAVQPGIHPSASVSPDAELDTSVSIGPQAVIGEGAQISARVFVGPGCVIGENVRIGEDTRLVANVTVLDGTVIGRRNIIHPGVVIGSDGFGMANDDGVWVKIPQIGNVMIGNDVEIGANTTIDKGALGDTIIEDGVKLDNQIQIGHNVRIGAHSAIAGCVGIAGSTTIGKRCTIGGGAGIGGHIHIADDVVITGMSAVGNSIKKPGGYASSIPVAEHRIWRKNVARFLHLDDMARRLMALEKDVKD